MAGIFFAAGKGVFEPAFAVGQDIKAIVARKDRALATETLSKGMEKLVPELYRQGKFDGIISFGGSGGTSLVTPAMRALPIGVPKVMVSTMASGNVAQYVGTSDIVMMPSIVDVAGLNKISKLIFSNAVLAIVGMVNLRAELKTVINAGFFAGVLDLTTTEWADQVVGGVLAAGEARCEAAVAKKIPQVVSVGACDMVNFGSIDTVPKEFAGRNFYKHNPTVTLMRTSVAENAKIAEKLASKWNKAQVPMTVLSPKRGVSMIDADGQPFNGVEERKTLFDTLKANINNELVEIRELDNNINDADFAETAAKRLIELIEGK